MFAVSWHYLNDYWIAMKVCINIDGPQKINITDVSIPLTKTFMAKF